MVSLNVLPIELHYKIFDNLPVKQLIIAKDVLKYAKLYLEDLDDVEAYPVVILMKECEVHYIEDHELKSGEIVGIYKSFEELVDRMLGTDLENSFLKENYQYYKKANVDLKSTSEKDMRKFLTKKKIEKNYQKLWERLEESRSFAYLLENVTSLHPGNMVYYYPFCGIGVLSVMRHFGVPGSYECEQCETGYAYKQCYSCGDEVCQDCIGDDVIKVYCTECATPSSDGGDSGSCSSSSSSWSSWSSSSSISS